jgi:hypothetical protein
MFSDKLGTLLQHFTSTELHRLGRFVTSAYFNENAQVIKLYEVLKKAALKAELDALTKPQIWKQANFAGAFQDATLRKSIFELTQLTYRFVAIEALSKDKWTETNLLYEATEAQTLEKHRVVLEKRLEELLKDEPTWRTEHFLRAHEHRFARLNQDAPSADLPDQLRRTKRDLDVFFVLRTLKIAITHQTYARSRKNEIGAEPDIEVVSQLLNGALLDVPLVQAYYQAYQCFVQPENEVLYQSFKSALQQQEPHLDVIDLYDLYQYALNLCVMRINAGSQDYYQELFDLYRTMTQNKLIVAKGGLSEGMFKNIITAGLAVREYAWVEQFIREQSRFLPELVRENAMSFNLANVYFSQKKYDDVIGLLQRVEYSDLVYQLGARWLLIRTYYELNAIKPLDSLLDSFRVFLLRNKVISAGTKKEYLSLISFTRRLLKHNHEKDKLKDLKAKVLTAQTKLPKRWLIEKIDELVS